MRITSLGTISWLGYLSSSDPIRVIEVQQELENRCNRRHCEFISIFNLIRNSFATIFHSASSPVDPLREVDLSLDLFQTSYVSAISHSTSVSPLPLYFPHRASLSLTSLFFLSQPFPSFSSYRCRFSAPFTRLISCYLLPLPSPTQ